ncbi:methyltransferase family protein [Planctomicrobium sp. SH527]|uniref:methyltransferase family protein n=1 Tax=Planctomicrobium sp. SH527 TaxID=3448123 RepID=UPI003F5C84EA
MVREILFFMGVCLASIGMLGRTWCNLFISGYKTKVLIQTGPYSMCRNPLYFFSAIGMLGIGLCSGTLAIPFMMLVFFAAYYPLIIRCEEDRLAATHPGDFEKYRRTISAFWPRLSTYQEPEAYTMFPHIMRKNIADAFWFMALAALVHVIADLHESNILPAYFKIW